MKIDMIRRRGLMLVLSSPSGAGKTSIARTLLKNDSQLTMSISATTRRVGQEKLEGKDYFFIDEAAFQDLKSIKDIFGICRSF